MRGIDDKATMKQVSIYHALGLSETASEREVAHGLRQTLREQYKKTRDNFGALEDSLRFYNQASQILNDKDRRKLYDTEWELSNASAAQRIDFVLKEAAAGQLAPAMSMVDVDATAAVKLATSLEAIVQPRPSLALELAPEGADLGFQIASPAFRASPFPPAPAPASSPALPAEPQENANEDVDATEASLAGEGDSEEAAAAKRKMPTAPPKVQHYHPVLTENLGQTRGPLFYGLGGGLSVLLIAGLFFAAWGRVAQWDFSKSWVWGALALLTLLLYGLGWQQGQKRRAKGFDLSGTPDDEAIKGWRRRRTVFLGSNFLPEDPSWVFQLRLTELERARVGRTSYPHPWRRALARLFDYALWGWLLFFPLQEISQVLPESLRPMLDNPLLAIVLITLTWIPVEALLMAAVGTTLGKWLFGVYVQFRVSTPYASRTGAACWRYAFQRAFRVWWQGIALGVAPLAPVAAGRARATLERLDETGWDEYLDALVTHTPIGKMLRAIGGIGLIVLLLMYVAVWQKPVFEMAEGGRQLAAAYFDGETESAGDKRNSVAPAPVANRPAGEAPVAGSSGTVSGDNAVRQSVAPTLSVGVEEAESQRRLAEFREAIVNAREESLLLLAKKDWRRAYESCQKWARLEVTNPEPMRCQGETLQAMGRYQEAINAFRSAKVYAPEDRSLDDAIARAQDEIFRAMNR